VSDGSHRKGLKVDGRGVVRRGGGKKKGRGGGGNGGREWKGEAGGAVWKWGEMGCGREVWVARLGRMGRVGHPSPKSIEIKTEDAP